MHVREESVSWEGRRAGTSSFPQGTHLHLLSKLSVCVYVCNRKQNVRPPHVPQGQTRQAKDFEHSSDLEKHFMSENALEQSSNHSRLEPLCDCFQPKRSRLSRWS